MKLESLKKFMSSELSEEIKSNVFGGKIANGGGIGNGNGTGNETAGGEVCVSATGLSSNSECATFSSDWETDWSVVYYGLQDIDKPC